MTAGFGFKNTKYKTWISIYEKFRMLMYVNTAKLIYGKSNGQTINAAKTIYGKSNRQTITL